MKSIFRNLVLLSVALYAVWFCIPYFSVNLYSPETLDAISWAGSDALLSFDSLAIVAFLFLFLYAITSVGLIYFKPWARISFLLLTLSSILTTPLFGIVVLPAIESSIFQVVNILDGVLIAFMYFTSVSNEFINSHNKALVKDAAR